MIHPLISVIIPVYGVEDYIGRCIESVLGQSYSNYELILVDDGSPDLSGTICDEYAKKDCRIRVYHKENGGASEARKYGVSKSLGLWVMFVDGDDIIPENSIELLMNLVSDSVDIIIGNGKYGDLSWFNQSVFGDFIPPSFLTLLFNAEIMAGPVAKLYRKELFEDLHWNVDKEIKQNEDLLMLTTLASRCKMIIVNSSIDCYRYLVRPGSASTGKMMHINCWQKLFTEINKQIDSFKDNNNLLVAFDKYKLRIIYSLCLQDRTINFKESEVINQLIINLKKKELTKQEELKLKYLEDPLFRWKINLIYDFEKNVKKVGKIVLCRHLGDCLTCQKYGSQYCVKNRKNKL